MKRCPNCKRFGVEYDPCAGLEKCIWNDCLWTNKTSKEIGSEKFDVNFKKFRDSLKRKMNVAI